MKKSVTSVSELVTQIEADLSAKFDSLEIQKEALQERERAFIKQMASFELGLESFNTEKAGFDALKSEVDQKFSKIRSNDQLSEDLISQASKAKQIEQNLKEVKEERALTDIQLQEVLKREYAASERDKNYEEELKKKIAENFLKG